MKTSDSAFLKDLLQPVAEKVAPFINTFQYILAVILISVAVVIGILLVIDWLVYRGKSKAGKKKVIELAKVPPVVEVPVEEIKKEPGIAEETPSDDVVEEIKTDEPAVTVESTPESEVILIEESVWFSPRKNTEELISEFKLQHSGSDIRFVTEFDDRLPEKIYGRQNLLNESLGQLLTNALEQTEKGVITVKLKMVKGNDTNCTIQFLVTDSGNGLPPDLLAAVQQKNFSFHPDDIKLQSVLTRLHSVKWSVEKQDGRLTVATKTGEGSTIGILLQFDV